MIQLNYYRHNLSGVAPELPKTNLSFYDLTVVLKGELYYSVNGQPYTVRAGEGIFIGQGCFRERGFSKLVDYVSFNFTTDENYSLPTHIQGAVNGEIIKLIGICDEIKKNHQHCRDKISKALDLILTIATDNLNKSNENPIILAIKQYISDNLSCKISLESVSEKVGYTPNYCANLFKKHVGSSIINFFNDQKINEAKNLIFENALSLSEIAQSLGFEDYNYFSRAFKKVTGYSPKTYKKLIFS